MKEQIALSPQQWETRDDLKQFGWFRSAFRLGQSADEYCRQAGIAAGHAARERLGCRVMELFQGGTDNSAELHAAMNSSYGEWLAEPDRLSSSSKPPVLWAIDPAIPEPSCAETVDQGGGGASRFPQADGADHSAISSPHPHEE